MRGQDRLHWLGKGMVSYDLPLFTCNQPLLSPYPSIFPLCFFLKPHWPPFLHLWFFPYTSHNKLLYNPRRIPRCATPHLIPPVPYLQPVPTLSLQGAPENLSDWLTAMGLTPTPWHWCPTGMPWEELDWSLIPLTGLLGFPQLPLCLWAPRCVGSKPLSS